VLSSATSNACRKAPRWMYRNGCSRPDRRGGRSSQRPGLGSSSRSRPDSILHIRRTWKLLLRRVGVSEMTDRQRELTDDLMHPIPRVHAYDTVLTLGGGGAYLGMVIAAPLDAGTRSLSRLREKQRFYLDSFYSEFGRKEWGTPKDGKMKIYVSVHPES